MDTEMTIHNEQIDDLPLLFGLLEKMGVQAIVDGVIEPHGNRQGLSVGWTVVIWLIHILRERNHCMNVVQGWVTKVPETLAYLTGERVEELDFTDDRLADALRYFSDNENWETMEIRMGRHAIRIYELPGPGIVRLDATSASVTHDEEGHTLFRRGWGKKGKTEVQFKTMLSTIDPLGLPIAVDVVSGEKSDDPLYLPIYRRSKAILGKEGLLYVGDSKSSAVKTRGTMHEGNDYYLTPLAYKGETPRLLHDAIERWRSGKEEAAYIHWPEEIPSEGEEPDPQTAIAMGFEFVRSQTVVLAGKRIVWQERCLAIRSTAYAEAMLLKFWQRLNKGEAALSRLTPAAGKGKRQIRDEKELKKEIKAVEKKYQVSGLIDIQYECEIQRREIRAYKDKPARTEEKVRYQITSISRNEEAVEQAAAMVGWRMYATNASRTRLSLTDAVLTYRNQYLVEQSFGRLKGRFLSITPLFVQRDDHALGLIRLLTLALRLMILSEYTARCALAEEKGELRGIYDGNPKRGTARPTTERMLRAFKHITLTVIRVEGRSIRHVTALNDVQQRILSLFGLSAALYAADLATS